MDSNLHIIGKISDIDGLLALNPLFAKAFAFLKRSDIAELPVGRHEIDGDACWANVMEVDLKPDAERRLEMHRRYIDIQAPLTGPESMGVAAADNAALALPFDEEKDYVLYDGKFESVILRPGDFAMFFPPRGAHAPCGRTGCGPDRIKKVVVKVAVSG